jgi:hypothetical protein
MVSWWWIINWVEPQKQVFIFVSAILILLTIFELKNTINLWQLSWFLLLVLLAACVSFYKWRILLNLTSSSEIFPCEEGFEIEIKPLSMIVSIVSLKNLFVNLVDECGSYSSHVSIKHYSWTSLSISTMWLSFFILLAYSFWNVCHQGKANIVLINMIFFPYT